jgi:hypothetical protein
MAPDFAALFAFCDLHAARAKPGELRPMYYDRLGFPIPADGVKPAAIVWAERMQAEQRVACDALPDGSRLSTVWLGLDHGMLGPPLFFETMRFTHDTGGDPLDFPTPEGDELVRQLRYGSEEEARAAHYGILRRLRIRLGH